MGSGEWRSGVLLDLEITVVSAKQLKNVNWRNGGVLKPYAVVYLDPDRRAATKVDHDGSTRPVWNERLTLPIPIPIPIPIRSSSSFQQQTGHQDRYQDEDDAPPPLFLTLDVFHSKPSETPKPLVGTIRVPLKEVLQQQQQQQQQQRQEDSSSSSSCVIKTLQLQRPSGRPQGKLRIKVAFRERPDLPNQPQYQYQYQNQNTLPPISPSYYYSSTSTAPQSLSGSTRPSSGEDYRHLTFSPPSPYPSSPPLPITPPPPPTLYSNPNLMPSPFPPLPPHTSYYNYPSAYSDPYLTTAPSPSPAPPALSPPLSYYGRSGSTYYGPSAPADYSLPPHSSSYQHKPSSSSRLGITGTGLAVGALAGSLKGLALEQGLKINHEEEQEEEEDNIAAAAERVESNLQTARDDYTHHMPATNYKS